MLLLLLLWLLRLLLLLLQVWCEVWRHLDGESLLRCRAVCHDWRREVRRLVLTSPSLLNNTFIILPRLSYHQGDDALEHRKSVRTCLRLSAQEEIIFHGVLVYTANDKEILGLSSSADSTFTSLSLS